MILLHGWTVTADLNWYQCYEALGHHFRVVAMDHRGHGRGIRSRRPFRLEDCADDVAALAQALGLGPAILVGYSMGGPVALLTWRRHPGLVAGMALCATAARFSRQDPSERLFYSSLLGLSVAARLAPDIVRRPLATAFARRRVEGLPLSDWLTEELVSGDPAAVLQAGSAIGSFDARSWLPQVNVPTAVVVTASDTVVSPRRQRALALAIPGASLHEVHGDHGACVSDPERFVPVLVEACLSVARQAGGTGTRR